MHARLAGIARVAAFGQLRGSVDVLSGMQHGSTAQVRQGGVGGIAAAFTPGRESYQPKTVGPAFVGVIRIRQRPCLIMAAR
jgi:hypothetical protein